MLNIIFFIATVTLTYANHPISDGRIVGGYDVDIKDFPYQLSLRLNGYHICGASIIGEKWVLTAAHCVFRRSPFSIAFRAGSTSKLIGGTVHRTKQIVVHPKYYGGSMDYDFAVVEVHDPFPIGQLGVQPANLASKEPTEGTFVISGWGYTMNQTNNTPLNLQAVEVKLVDRSECNKKYDELTPRMICAMEVNKDSCQGDSGGPLFNKLTNEQVGIVSYGHGCADPNYPGVYSNIADQLDWIKKTIGM